MNKWMLFQPTVWKYPILTGRGTDCVEGECNPIPGLTQTSELLKLLQFFHQAFHGGHHIPSAATWYQAVSWLQCALIDWWLIFSAGWELLEGRGCGHHSWNPTSQCPGNNCCILEHTIPFLPQACLPLFSHGVPGWSCTWGWTEPLNCTCATESSRGLKIRMPGLHS